MLYHVHHILNDLDTVRGSFPQFNTARAVAVGLTDAEGGQAYITRASVIQWDGRNDFKCIKDRCFSPIACGGFGYCRELNFENQRSKQT